MRACLVVDLHMPEMSGLDLQRNLLKLGISIPTIVVTGDDGHGAAPWRFGFHKRNENF